jgi:hypothetical protein
MSARSSPVKKKKAAQSIVDRLTDTSKYTGAHKARFNQDGSGRGLAGRANLVDYSGAFPATDERAGRRSLAPALALSL